MKNVQIAKQNGSYLNSITGVISNGDYFEASFNGKKLRFNARVGIARVRSEVASRIAHAA